MKLSRAILATLILISGAVQATPAAQNDAEKSAPPTAAQPSKAARMPYEEDLDKIDDVNPYVIKSVIVEGNKLIPRSQIKAVIKTKPGDFYHRKDVETDIREIYKLGYFAPELHIKAETTAAGLVLTIHVKENPFLKSITFSGNTIMPTERLQELFKNQSQKPRNMSEITAAIKIIENTYKTQGYLLAHASIGADEPAGTMPVIIDEGIVKEIKISCPSDEQKKLVQDALTQKIGSPYNEKQLAVDLKAAMKSAKLEQLQREVDKDKSGGFIVSIKSIAKEKEGKKSTTATTSTTLLKSAKSKPALPVLNRLIHSPMYKDINK